MIALMVYLLASPRRFLLTMFCNLQQDERVELLESLVAMKNPSRCYKWKIICHHTILTHFSEQLNFSFVAKPHIIQIHEQDGVP
jgi:hypothetical protein